MPNSRYAVYYAPPRDSVLWQFGIAWLGRDPETGRVLDPPPVPDLPPSAIAELTAAPARYGFHATLKAPFRPAPGATHDAIEAAAAGVASATACFTVDPPTIIELDGFLAIGYDQTPAPLARLAEQCVRLFDRFRAPLTASERQRRAEGLTDRQKQLFDAWGYPYVLDCFRFHLTLTGRLPTDERQRVREALLSAATPVLAESLAIDSLALFAEPDTGQPFQLLARYPLVG